MTLGLIPLEGSNPSASADQREQTANKMKVMAAENSSDPKQPRRFEKKRNMGAVCPLAVALRLRHDREHGGGQR